MEEQVDRVFEIIGKDLMDAPAFIAVEELIKRGIINELPSYPACDDSQQAPFAAE